MEEKERKSEVGEEKKKCKRDVKPDGSRKQWSAEVGADDSESSLVWKLETGN